MKDNFSLHSEQYAKYRPTYPRELFDYLNSLVPVKQCAWDCGTGNGQVAFELARSFASVYATDISQDQLDNALQSPLIHYSVQPAEHTSFEAEKFDLVVVAQAIHWFNFDEFYAEVRRTSSKDGLLCVIGYGNIEISNPLDTLMAHLYRDIVGPYWDPERRYIDEGYRTIPFPFLELQTPQFENRVQWNFEQLIGYLNTWSAVKHFVKKNNYNPVTALQEELLTAWGDEPVREMKFPLLTRVGKVAVVG